MNIFKKLSDKINSLYAVQNYRKILPYVRPYWIRALLAVLITIPIGSMDAVIAWSLKPYMDVVMVEKSTASTALYSDFDYSFQPVAEPAQLCGDLYEYLGRA